MIRKMFFATTAAALVATSAFAAGSTDGSLSSTASTGSLAIGATIPQLVKISGLTDITLSPTAADIATAAATAPYAIAAQADEKVCIFSNVTSAGSYGITISGTAGPSGGNENFGLPGTGGASAYTLPFRVAFADSAAGSIYTLAGGNLANGTHYAGQATTDGGQARPLTLNCSGLPGSTNADVHVQFPVQGLLNAIAGTYAGSLTITVSPT